MRETKTLPFQLTLTAMLALFVAVWSGMVLLESVPGLLVVLLTAFALLFVKTWGERLTIVTVGGMLAAMMLPAVTSSHAPMYADGCRSHMAKIAWAIRTYHDQYGQFPPACVRDAKGRPMHSWRVLILPQLGYESLYAAYRFDEPWNSPNNIALLDKIPWEYVCRALVRPYMNSGITACVAITGPEGMWPENRPMRRTDIRDGDRETIMLGEADPGLAIQWLEPRDIKLDKVGKGIRPMDWSGATVADGLVAAHPWPLGESEDPRHVAHVVMADGAVRALPEDVRGDAIRGLLTAAGGESVDVDSLVAKPPPKPSRAGKIASAVLLVVSLGVMIVSLHRHRRATVAGDDSPSKASDVCCEKNDEESSGTA